MSAVTRALRRHALNTPDAVALRGPTRTLTYAELGARAARLARKLDSHGVRMLAIAADNSPDWVVVDLAARLAGVPLVPLPTFFSPGQIRHVLDDSGADAVVLDAAAAPRTAALDLGFVTDVGAAEAAVWCIRGAGEPAALPEGTAKVSYTSGTTGRPKGVCLAQSTLDRVAESLCAATGALEISRHVCLLPLATLLENVAGVYAPILRGAEIALPGLAAAGWHGAARFDARRMIDCLRTQQAHSVILLPQMLADLVTEIEAGLAPPAALRFAAVGGGFVARSLLERSDRLRLPVYEGYGLTECASVVALNTPEACRPGSVGRPLAHAEVRLGAGGRILVAGAAMRGYLGESTPATRLVDTGDLGFLDADGFLHVNGRSKNLFITSFGRNVSPEWVEAELASTSSIAQAALFGEARPWNVAVVVPAAGIADLDAIRRDVDAANAALPDYARAHQWIPAQEPFTPGNGLLTGNGRNRREAIGARYRRAIDACYDACIGPLQQRGKEDHELL